MKKIEFKNIEYSNECIAADMYLEDKFIVRLSVDSLEHLVNSADTNIGLYEYFRQAMMICIAKNGTNNLDKATAH
jgi:hypothetical protein